LDTSTQYQVESSSKSPSYARSKQLPVDEGVYLLCPKQM